jgi:hypothetical protein
MTCVEERGRQGQARVWVRYSWSWKRVSRMAAEKSVGCVNRNVSKKAMATDKRGNGKC